VLESCFGKLKGWRGSNRGAFHRSGAEPGSECFAVDAAEVAEALERCRSRTVMDWCRKMIGVTVQSQRKQAYGHPSAPSDPG